jgi:hypothetical protein
MPKITLQPQIFDPNLNDACIWDDSSMISNCNFTMSDNSRITQLKNISTVIGPSKWVPVINNESIPPACVKIQSKLICLHYPDDQTKRLYNLQPDVQVVQQTFSKNYSKTDSKSWIQDYPPDPIPLINNPSDTTQMINSDSMIVQSEDDFNNNPVPIKLLDNYKISPTIPTGSNKSYITLNPNGPNPIAFPYNDSSDIAPNCIITTPNCTLAAPTSKCMITCPTMDESNIIKYSYNKKNHLWVDPILNSLIS